MSLPVFDYTICDCQKCELLPQRAKTFTPSQPPSKDFSGLMLVGEGPGVEESRRKLPFIGRAGQCLTGMLEAAGIDRATCYIANATSCLPAMGQKGDKGLVTSCPNTVPSCLPRLLQEIEKARPRVIVALGEAALTALTGEDRQAVREYDRPHCAVCSGRRLVPRWTCLKCKADNAYYGEVVTTQEAAYSADDKVVCSACDWSAPQVQLGKTRKKCPACEGRKKDRVEVLEYVTDWKISWVAGGVFRGKDLGLDAFGVEYVIPTYHPSFIIRGANQSASGRAFGGQFLANAVVHHLQKAKRLLTDDAHWNVTVQTTTDAERIGDYTGEVGANVHYAVDIETDAKNPADVTKITCIGIQRFYETTPKHPETLVIDTTVLSKEGFAALFDFLQDGEAHKVFQNGIYDTDVIERVWKVKTNGFVGDTLIAHTALAPDEPHNLHHIAFTYTDAFPWKPPKHLGGMESFQSKEELHEYNGRDACATAQAMRRLWIQLDKEGLRNIHDIDLQMVFLARRMRQTGIAIDMTRRLEVESKARSEMAEALAEMRKILNVPEFNPSSSRQIVWALFDQNGPFKLPPVVTTEKGEPSADKRALARYRDHAFVKEIIRYRAAKHTIGVYIEGMTVRNNRIHFEWNPLGARTGRWTSSPNAQNLDKEHKWMFKPQPGRVLVGADYAQQQYRVLASMAGDTAMIHMCMHADENRKLEPDFDPHSYVSRIAFGDAFLNLALKDPAHKKDNCKCQTCARKALRDLTKRVVYGLFFGGGTQTVRDSIIGDPSYDGPMLTVEMVQEVINAFHRAFPRVKPFQEHCYKRAIETYEVKEPVLGRRRVFPLGEVDYTVATNFPVQAADASIMTLGLLDLVRELPSIDPSAEIIALVHDAVYVECQEDKAEAVGRVIEQSLTCEMSLAAESPEMLFQATSHSGEDWGSV